MLRAGIIILISTLLAVPSQAAAKPIHHTFFGVQDDHQTNHSTAYGAARLWKPWCQIQPSAQVPARTGADRILAPAFAANAKAQRTRVTVLLGHPAPWVYNNHPNAHKKTGLWYCAQNRSGIAFPSVALLRTTRVRAAYVNYVAAVISAAEPYLAANPANRVALQAWNEPNVGSGGNVKTGIPGAATSWKRAASSLREQERLIRAVARRMIPGRYEITSPSFVGKSGKLVRAYFGAQAKARTIDSASVNFYTQNVSTPNGSLRQWRTNAAKAKRIVTRYKALRGLPIWITETNHNLINYSPRQTNMRRPWTAPSVQRRLAEVTTMEAMRLGFAGIEWYQGALAQTAVNTRPGTPATAATARLNSALRGRTIIGCGTNKGVSWCRLSARPGNRAIRVTWANSGAGGVQLF